RVRHLMGWGQEIWQMELRLTVAVDVPLEEVDLWIRRELASEGHRQRRKSHGWRDFRHGSSIIVRWIRVDSDRHGVLRRASRVVGGEGGDPGRAGSERHPCGEPPAVDVGWHERLQDPAVDRQAELQLYPRCPSGLDLAFDDRGRISEGRAGGRRGDVDA